jgi:hypothetical protein
MEVTGWRGGIRILSKLIRVGTWKWFSGTKFSDFTEVARYGNAVFSILE